MNPSFANALNIQLRVIYALTIRELITRYGRKNIGFLWILLEPMIFVAFMSIMFYFVRQSGMNVHLNPVAFALSGYTLLLLWRNATSRAISAVSANKALLYHRHVKVLDLFTARVLLECIGTTLAFVILILLTIFLLDVPKPINPMLMIVAWLLMCWFGLGLGYVVGAFSTSYEVFGRIWGTLTLGLIPLSAAPFMLDWLPNRVRDFLLFFPMAHASELMRDGYFGHLITSHYSIFYIIQCNLVLTFIGLLMVRRLSKNGNL